MIAGFLALLQSLSLVAIGAAVLLCFTALLIKRMLKFTGFSVYLCVGLWTVSLCLWCGANVYLGWGLTILLMGILFGGVGVVPAASLCFLFSGKWRELFELAIQIVPIVAGNIVASWMLEQDFLHRRIGSKPYWDFRRRLPRARTSFDNFAPNRAAAGTLIPITGWSKGRRQQ